MSLETDHNVLIKLLLPICFMVLSYFIASRRAQLGHAEAMAESNSWVSWLKAGYFTPEVTRALEQLSCLAEIRKGSSFAAGVDIPTKRISVIDLDIENPDYVFVLVELHPIRGLAALRDAEKGQAMSASPLVLLRSGIGILCRASCLGQTLLATKTGNTIIMAYVRLLVSELERFRAAQFSLQVIMVLEGTDSSSREGSATRRLDLVLLESDKVPLHEVESDANGWRGKALRSFAEVQAERDAFSWVMLSSQQHLARWDGVTRYNPKERLCAGVIDCDFIACPAIFISDARMREDSIWFFRLLSCASAFGQQLGDQAEKRRDQRSREEVVEELGRTMSMASKVLRWPPESSTAQLRNHCADLKHELERSSDVDFIYRAITRIVLGGEPF